VTSRARQKPRRLWRWIPLALVITIVLVAIVSWLQPTPLRFELLTADDYYRRTKRFAFIHDARAQMTRISVRIFGFDPVDISAAYVASSVDTSNLRAQLPQPHYSSNAVQVWILSSNVVARTERGLRTDRIAGFRNSSSEGVPSVVSMGTPTGRGPGSVEFASHPKVRGSNVDLAAKLTAIIANREPGAAAQPMTNQIAFRLLLKPDEGAILVDGTAVLFIWAHAP
jgi:hypothetical protein